MRGDGETLVLGSSRSLDCGGLIHNTSCPAPPCPCQQMALWWVKFFFPVGSWEAVPPHCILPGCTESAMPLLLSPNLRYICGSCEKRKKKMQIRIRGNHLRRAERETPRHEGTFSGFLLLGYRKSRRERDSGSLCPTSLHLPDIRPPTTPALALHSSENILYANFIITPQRWSACVYVQWRGDISFYLAYEMSWD